MLFNRTSSFAGGRAAERMVRVRFAGARRLVPRRLLTERRDDRRRPERRLTLLRFNYGGRAEIGDAVRELVAGGASATLTEKPNRSSPLLP